MEAIQLPVDLTIFMYDYSVDTLKMMSEDLKEDIENHTDFYSDDEMERLTDSKKTIDFFIENSYGEEIE